MRTEQMTPLLRHRVALFVHFSTCDHFEQLVISTVSKEIGKAWRKRYGREARERSLFSASFQTFCLTARAYLNTQKYGLFYSLQRKLNSKN